MTGEIFTNPSETQGSQEKMGVEESKSQRIPRGVKCHLTGNTQPLQISGELWMATLGLHKNGPVNIQDWIEEGLGGPTYPSLLNYLLVVQKERESWPSGVPTGEPTKLQQCFDPIVTYKAH